MPSSDFSVMLFKSFDLDFNCRSSTYSTDPHVYIHILVTNYLYIRIAHFHFMPLFRQTSDSHWHLISFFPCKVQESILVFTTGFWLPVFPFLCISFSSNPLSIILLAYHLCLSSLFQILCSIFYLLIFAPHSFPSICTSFPCCLNRNTVNTATWDRLLLQFLIAQYLAGTIEGKKLLRFGTLNWRKFRMFGNIEAKVDQNTPEQNLPCFKRLGLFTGS